ncbi:MAG: 2-dehydropantoate 2-reductase [Halopseudomonas sp.]
MITNQSNSWHILGAGAIGSLWACQLSLAGNEIRLILRNSAALKGFTGQIQLSGQSVEGAVPLQAELAENHQPIQRLLVATKSYDCLAAIDSIRHRLSPSSVIVLLQNGMGQQQQAAELLPDIALFAGTTTEGAYRLPPNKLIHAGRGESWIGPINETARNLGATALDRLQQLPLKTGYDEAIINRLWQKLAINAAINGLTAKYDCQNGRLADHPDYCEQMQQLCNETEAIAKALEQPLFDRPLLEVALQIARATGSNYSSMLQDVRNGGQTEIDYINGFICRQANQLGLDTPHHQALVASISRLHPQFSEH